MATSSVVLDTSQYVRVNIGYTSMILEAHRDDVRIVLSDAQPVKSNVSFHQLGGGDAAWHISVVDTNVWVLAMSDRSSLVVTEQPDTPSINYKAADLDDASTTQYFGFVTPGGAWYIMRLDTTAGTIRHVKGAADYTTNWTGRVALTYDYLFNVF